MKTSEFKVQSEQQNTAVITYIMQNQDVKYANGKSRGICCPRDADWHETKLLRTETDDCHWEMEEAPSEWQCDMVRQWVLGDQLKEVFPIQSVKSNTIDRNSEG